MAEPTRYADLSRATRLGILFTTVLAVVILLGLALWTPPPSAAVDAATAATGADGDLYAAILGRMQGGEGYYPAAHQEMLARGYGTASVFNWRTPFHMSALRWLGGGIGGQVVLAALGLAAGALSVASVLRADGRARALLFGVLVFLSLAAVIAPGTVYFSEVTAGVLMLLSVAAYGLGLRWAGFAAGLLALFLRELAIVYVLVALAIAVRQRWWREAVAWAAGLLAYAVYFGWHAQMVLGQLGPGDPAYPDSWLSFGGLRFVLATAQVDGLLFALPLWVTAVVLPIAVLALAGWRAPQSLRVLATVALYLLAFLCVGKPFNNYWGAVYTPLMAFGLAAVPAALADLTGFRSRQRS
ncbi:MAG: hypothetical protein ACTHOR_05385 [Devosia sp.]